MSSPSSMSSPGRTSNVALSRPQWPGAWSSSSSLLRQSYSRSSSVGNWVSRGMSPAPSSQWQQQAQSTPKQSTILDDTSRQWSFLGFEWVVRNVHKLKDFIEGSENEEDDFDILKQSPILGDHKFKLEISRANPNQDADAQSNPSLCLYITSLTLDFAMPDFELSATMMAAIKCQDDRVGERGARPEWVWEFWQHDFVFRQDSEVWACPLPPLSELLQNSRIKETDSLVICVQIHSPGPVGATFPAQPSAYYVPRDLLDGLEASLDNPNTGDVRFVCLERLKSDSGLMTPPLPASEAPSPTTLRSPSSNSTSSPLSGHTTARKRIIYAHSDILIRRSEYFATMLASSFAETNPQGVAPGERKLYTIVVEEADFETVYWLLKFCYANWLLFKEQDDPRAAVDGIGAGWSAKWLNQGPRGQSEWDWKTFTKFGNNSVQDADTRSATSGEGEGARSPVATKSSKPSQPPSNTAPARTSTASTARTSSGAPNTVASKPSSRPSGTSVTVTPTTPRRPSGGNTSSTATANMSMSGANQSKQVPVPLTLSHSHYANSQRRQPTMIISTPDPHKHPTLPPSPASALSMYHVAHRYGMPALSGLALEHMLSTLTPESSFALLLASSAWEELRSLVEDYIVEKWDEVALTEDFERCCQEVAAGEWGTEGGTTLTALFRRLRSPSTLLR